MKKWAKQVTNWKNQNGPNWLQAGQMQPGKKIRMQKRLPSKLAIKKLMNQKNNVFTLQRANFIEKINNRQHSVIA